MSRSTCILAADIGTSSLKAAMVEADGQVLATARRAYPTAVAGEGWAEQDPDDWLDALEGALADLRSQTDLKSACGLVFTGQMSAALLVDADLDPVRPCIIWSDQRADKQASAAARMFGAEPLFARTGNPPSATYTAPKLAWLAEHEAGALRRARAFVQPKDWLVGKLTGQLVTDPSDASCTGLVDLRAGQWDPDLFAAYGLPIELAPAIVPSASVAGRLAAEPARRLGLKAGLPVVAGGGDGPVTAAGSGAVADRDTCLVLGTSGWVSCVARHPALDPDRGLANFVHVVPGHFVETGSMQAAGASLEWAAQVLGMDVRALVEMALSSPAPEAHAPMFMPYLQGERTPYWTAMAAGTFFGLGRSHRRQDLSAAVMEGVLLQARLIAEMASGTANTTPIVMSGGFAGSQDFVARLADTLQRRVLPLKDSDHATALGAALVGFVGLGMIDDWSVSARWARHGRSVDPKDRRAANDARFLLFKDSWREVRRLNERLAGLAAEGSAEPGGQKET